MDQKKFFNQNRMPIRFLLFLSVAFFVTDCRSLGTNRMFRPGVEMASDLAKIEPSNPKLDFSKMHLSLKMGPIVKSTSESFEEGFFRGKETSERFKALVKEMDASGSFKSVVWEEFSRYEGQPGVIYGELDLAEIRNTNHWSKSPFLLLALVGYFLFPTKTEIISNATLTLHYSDSSKSVRQFKSIAVGTSYEHFGDEFYRKLFNDIKLRHVENFGENFE